ncbi:MAG: hypothetical protein EOP06_18350 [Proteobacteria bacterium]|nr:MAG: hypothetical protein EOP06_18350 [Pseudomonadota bacterium]
MVNWQNQLIALKAKRMNYTFWILLVPVLSAIALLTLNHFKGKEDKKVADDKQSLADERHRQDSLKIEQFRKEITDITLAKAKEAADHALELKKNTDSINVTQRELLEKQASTIVLQKELQGKTEEMAKLNEQLKMLGLKFEFYPSSEKFLSAKTASESPVKMSGRVTDLVDPLIMFASFKDSSPYKYEKPLKDEKFEELYSRAAIADTRDERVDGVVDLSAYAVANAIVCPFIEDANTIYYDPTVIKSLGKQTQSMTMFVDRFELSAE